MKPGDSMQLIRRLTPSIFTLGITCWGLQAPTSGPTSFSAAYIHPGSDGHPELTVFPNVGREITIPLPQGLSSSITVNAFSPEGDAIYVQDSTLGGLDGIRKVEFKPARQSIVNGTAGLGSIWHLTVLRPSGSIFISGIANTLRGAECGTFEVDQNGGGLRRLLAGAYPECGGGGGAVSPDGKQVLGYSGGKLCMIDLAGGALQAIKGLDGLSRADVMWKKQVTWSPDGHWIIVSADPKRLVLIDTRSPFKQKKLGPLADGAAVAAPDAKRLLVLKSQAHCSLALYFQSLETIDIETGVRSVIKSSQCKLSGGFFGWINLTAVR
jgi:hypothetical protein